MIDSVRAVTHIAPPDAKGNIIGEPISQEGVVAYVTVTAAVTGAAGHKGRVGAFLHSGFRRLYLHLRGRTTGRTCVRGATRGRFDRHSWVIELPCCKVPDQVAVHVQRGHQRRVSRALERRCASGARVELGCTRPPCFCAAGSPTQYTKKRATRCELRKRGRFPLFLLALRV